MSKDESVLQSGKLLSGAFASIKPISDPSEKIARAPSEPTHRVRLPASCTEGVEPKAKRDFVMSYDAPTRGAPDGQPAEPPSELLAEPSEVLLDPLPLSGEGELHANSTMQRNQVDGEDRMHVSVPRAVRPDDLFTRPASPSESTVAVTVTPTLGGG